MNTKKAYDKAMSYYEKGKINKALEICEEILLEELENEAVLNFKGLLLYQKGNLDDAITTWKINKELNNNKIAKKYIEDAAADEERLVLYKQGEQALKQLKINRALELFNICAESDFNAIKVNTGIALCYQKKGDLYKAKEYMEKALSIDESAITARNIRKELKEDGVYLEKQNSSKPVLIGVTSLFIVFAIVAGGYLIVSKFKDKGITNNREQVNDNKMIEEENNISEEIQEPEIQKTPEVNQEPIKEETKSVNFDKDKLKTLIANKDLDGVYEQLKSINAQPTNSEDIEIYNQAVSLMKNEGVSKFYEYGLWSFNEGKYEDAATSLEKAYRYCEGNSLKEHVLFYRASTTYKQQNNQTALPQYEEYYNQYPNGVYAQEALYQLALLSNSVDKQKSKNYANTLINNYPNSIYVNDNIVSIARG